jgi:hypothetical protein
MSNEAKIAELEAQKLQLEAQLKELGERAANVVTALRNQSLLSYQKTHSLSRDVVAHHMGKYEGLEQAANLIAQALGVET